MKIQAEVVDGEAVVILSDVFSGVGIRTGMGLFGVAQRDGGIEVMLDGKTVWTSHELRSASDVCGPLPDGSGFFTASWPLPKDHWIYQENPDEPPAPMRTGIGDERRALVKQIREAAKYAIRGATMRGKEKDFDPDSLIQNLIVGLLGYWTEDGR